MLSLRSIISSVAVAAVLFPSIAVAELPYPVEDYEECIVAHYGSMVNHAKGPDGQNNGWDEGDCTNNPNIHFWINDGYYGRLWNGNAYECWDASKDQLFGNLKKLDDGAAKATGWSGAFACHVGVHSS